MQLDSERIADFKTAQALIHPPETEEIERRQIIEFHEARLRWRLQQAFEDHRRRLQQPVAEGMNRPRLVKGKPRGFA